ncbi:hypothetical protein CRX60_03500 [Pseudomonas aeruginosa]|nr:hypothetical protein CRX60_03500 [Pseudomonas aeruginosa]
MQHAVFRSDVIITIEETKKAIKSLLGAFLGRDKVLSMIETAIEGEKINDRDFVAKLKAYGDSCPSEFFRSFEKGFVRDFKKTYPLDGTLTASEKDRLSFEEAKQKQHKKEFRDKIRAKEDISTEFDSLISEYSQRAVAKASDEFKKSLELTLDIIPGGADEEFDEYEDQVD